MCVHWFCIQVHVVVYHSHAYLVMPNGPWGRILFIFMGLRRILLCALGHSTEFWYAWWATAKNFVRSYGSRRRIIDLSAELRELCLKACHNLKRNSKAKNCSLIKYISQGLHHPYFPAPSKLFLSSFLAKGEKDFALWATAQNYFWIWITRQIWSWIWNCFRLCIRGLSRFDSWYKKTTRGRKYRETIPLSWTVLENFSQWNFLDLKWQRRRHYEFYLRDSPIRCVFRWRE